MDQTFHERDLVCLRIDNDLSLEFGRITQIGEGVRTDRQDKRRGVADLDTESEFNVELSFSCMTFSDDYTNAQEEERNNDENGNIKKRRCSLESSNNETINSGVPIVTVLWNADDINFITNYNTTRTSSINPLDVNLKVVDRRFIVGQRVTCDGFHGTVMRCERLVTLNVVRSAAILPMIIRDVKLEKIEPLSKLFDGVMVEYGGWIGQVTRVFRKAFFKPANGPEFFTRPVDPHNYGWKHEKEIVRYPYIPHTHHPYVGREKKFGPWELELDAFMTESECRVNKHEAKKFGWQNAICHSVEVTEISVNWMGRLPNHLPSWENVPNATIQGSEIERVHPLYINHCMYFDKNGISNCLSTNLMTKEQWVKDFFCDQPKMTNNNRFNESFLDEETTSKDGLVLVEKLFSRHVYEVKWDSNSDLPSSQPTNYFGFELEPEYSYEDSLRFIFSKFYFCKRNSQGVGFAENEYGVVLEKGSDATLMVQWVKILDDGTVEPCGLEQCSFLDIVKHPMFGDMCEGRVVVASKMARSFSKSLNLLVGTVLNIDRWDFGKVSVYCAIEQRKKILWPHEIEVFKELPVNEQIRLKLAGNNTNKGKYRSYKKNKKNRSASNFNRY